MDNLRDRLIEMLARWTDDAVELKLFAERHGDKAVINAAVAEEIEYHIAEVHRAMMGDQG